MTPQKTSGPVSPMATKIWKRTKLLMKVNIKKLLWIHLQSTKILSTLASKIGIW